MVKPECNPSLLASDRHVFDSHMAKLKFFWQHSHKTDIDIPTLPRKKWEPI